LNKTIKVIEFTNSGRYKSNPPEGYTTILHAFSYPIKATNVDVKGKFMWWEFEGATTPWYMWITYGMSGQFSTKKTKHTLMIVHLEDGELYFNDARHFGTVKFVNDEKQHVKKLNSLGPDLLGDPLVTSELFAQKILKKHNRTICEALMDQSCVSGVGNYLRAEILFDCNVDPWRNVTEITSEEYVKLHEATVRIAKLSYKSHGASIKTYRNVDGSAGTTQFNFKAYGRKVCPLDHEITRRQDRNRRMMYWCGLCQK
jgi:DNA-formamidopyrimidine glycosylase